MNRLAAAAALLLSASPAFAAASGSIYDQDGNSLEGIYAAVAGGGQLMITEGDNAFGYDAEGRVGYSFNPALQIYLAASLDSSSFSAAVRALLPSSATKASFLLSGEKASRP